MQNQHQQQQQQQSQSFNPLHPPPFGFPIPPFASHFPLAPPFSHASTTQASVPPPDDPEQKSIIDKLAQFVVRNGHEFEAATRAKQHDNPRFRFLFGGEYHAYYQHRLNLERDLMRFQQVPPPQIAPQPAQFSFPPPIADPASLAQLNVLQMELNTLKEQILQSEKNLQGQNEFLNKQKKIKIEESLKSVVNEKLNALRAESSIDFNELERLSNKIVQVCTKDAISAGRNFVFHNNLSEKHVETICYYLTQKIIDNESSNNARLHLIYFMNDLVHYANKKRIDMAKRQIERVIIPCFCYAMDKTDEEKKIKMNKLLDIWEKDNYFSPEIIEKLRNPSVGVKYYQESIYSENSQLIDSIETEIDTQLKFMENQHKEYVNHCNAQIVNVQNQIAQIKQKQQQHFMHIPPPIHLPPPNLLNQLPQSQQSSNNGSSPSKPQPLMSLMSLNLNPKEGASKQQLNQSPTSSISQPLLPKPPVQTSQQSGGKMPLMSIPPPNVLTNSPSHSGHSGLLPTPNIEPIKPSASIQPPKPNLDIEMAYYSLPAGLMTQLVKTENEAYKPIDPKQVKLPAPQAPSERLIKAMEEFYSSQSKPRNLEGWSKTGLYEFYKLKLKSLADKPMKNQSNETRSRRSTSKSSSSSRSRSRGRRRRGRSSSSSSRSNSSRRRRRHSSSSSSSRSSRSSSRSSRTRQRARSSDRSRSATTQRARAPVSRSPTPPQHVGFSSASMDTRIDMSNKGHQMLQRMGWSGQTGLGRTEQGMVNPINASGDVRDNTEMYRGIGVKSDPFEAFRKNKSKGYIQRIRSRDEQREIMRKNLDKPT